MNGLFAHVLKDNKKPTETFIVNIMDLQITLTRTDI